ncbi:MAG: 4Fe-4S dicluster domain-containing protein [Desulfobulbales bacterium]
MNKGQITRRRFLQQAAMLAVLPVFSGHNEILVVRPPGAGPDFLARCIRCGKCMEACPYDTIRLFDLTAGALVHTPYISPLQTPCYLCQQRGGDGKDRPLSKYLRCGEVCPTGALRRIVNDKEVLANVPADFKTAPAELNRKLCLAWQYDSCGECYYNCPLKDKAMLDRPPDYQIAGTGIRPHVNPEHCIGCGMCNFVCPVRRHIAESVMKRDVKLTLFEERYAGMVRNVIGRAGKNVKLPAVRLRSL